MINSDQFSKAQSLILAIRKVLKAEELRESKFSFVNILNVGRVFQRSVGLGESSGTAMKTCPLRTGASSNSVIVQQRYRSFLDRPLKL